MQPKIGVGKKKAMNSNKKISIEPLSCLLLGEQLLESRT